VNPDPHADLRDRVFTRVLEGEGETPTSLRNAVARGQAVPGDLKALVDKIHQHAYKVSDADIAHAQAIYGDDKMFEIVVSSALGAARTRFEAGLKALDEA
jgi:hypothetical protein